MANANIHQDKTTAKVVSTGYGLKSSKHTEKKIIGAKKIPVFVLRDGEDEEEDVVGGQGWDEEKNKVKKDSIVYIGDMLNLEDTIEHGKEGEGVCTQLPVVTRSGRVVTMGLLG